MDVVQDWLDPLARTVHACQPLVEQPAGCESASGFMQGLGAFLCKHPEARLQVVPA